MKVKIIGGPHDGLEVDKSVNENENAPCGVAIRIRDGTLSRYAIYVTDDGGKTYTYRYNTTNRDHEAIMREVQERYGK